MPADDGRLLELRRIAVNGVRLAYEDVGAGPAIVFMHGFMLDRTMWRSQVAALDGWRRTLTRVMLHRFRTLRLSTLGSVNFSIRFVPARRDENCRFVGMQLASIGVRCRSRRNVISNCAQV